LLKLTSLAHIEGFYNRPRIDKELLEQYCEGLICTTACMGGIVPILLLEDQFEEAKKEALFYKGLFGEDFYIELQRHNYPEDKILIPKLVQLSKEIDVKLIATNDIHYIRKEDAIPHNAFLLINKNTKGKDETIKIEDLRYKTNEFYFRSQDEMIALFNDLPDAISNTLEIADKCDLTLDLTTHYMPEFPIPATTTATTLDEYLKELVFLGLKERYSEITAEIKQRAEFELSVISKMKFPGYFLIV
jgi:DNA polymerase-3 subunit alpha